MSTPPTIIDITEVEANFDAILERCEKGETFLITIDGEDTCFLLPYVEYEELHGQGDVEETTT